MAATYTLHVEAGATFTRQFEYTNEDGTLFNLTGFTAKLQIRETPDSELALEVIPTLHVPTAMISFTLTAQQTSTLVEPKYVWALELYGPNGLVIRLIEGKVVVSAEVVR